MTISELEDYMSRLFANQHVLGDRYVTRQVNWAESEIQKKLAAEKGSSMAESIAPGETPSGSQPRFA